MGLKIGDMLIFHVSFDHLNIFITYDMGPKNK
jgi:hypothetical protein